MIGDIIEIARARAMLGEATLYPFATEAPRCGVGEGHQHVGANSGDELADVRRWNWASLARTAIRLLQVH